MPPCLFDDLEELDFKDVAQSVSTKEIQRGLTSLPAGDKMPYEVERIVTKRELQLREIKYRVSWVGYPNKKDNTWEPGWRLKADVPKIVRAYERSQRDIRNSGRVEY
jgi:hypothetical protein